jgi:hypothetical protein
MLSVSIRLQQDWNVSSTPEPGKHIRIQPTLKRYHFNAGKIPGALSLSDIIQMLIV